MSKELLADFTDCLDEDAADARELVKHAEAFVRWRANMPLETLDEDDVLYTFLLDWWPPPT